MGELFMFFNCSTDGVSTWKGLDLLTELGCSFDLTGNNWVLVAMRTEMTWDGDPGHFLPGNILIITIIKGAQS